MLKSELIEHLITQFPQLEAQQVHRHAKLLIQTLINALSQGHRIEIRGFASFSLRYNRARSAFNPKTGQYFLTVGKYRVHFKPGKQLRLRINQPC